MGKAQKREEERQIKTKPLNNVVRPSLLNPTFYSILFIVLLVLLSTSTYSRNIVWKDEVSLWKDGIKKSPEKARGYNNLGKALQDEDHIDESIIALQRAITLTQKLLPL